MDENEDFGGIMVAGLYVPPIGLFGVKNMKWGATTSPEKRV